MRKNIIAAIAAAFVLFSFTACQQTATIDGAAAAEVTATTVPADEVTASPLSADSVGENGTILLSDNASSADCAGVSVSGNVVTISAAGSYILNGSLSDGQIVIAANDADKVELTLNGVSISCSNSAAIYAKTADKLIVALADGSENALSSTGEFVQTDDNTVDAALFSKCDLTLKGDGLLNVSCTGGHGIVTKDDLKISGGNYVISAADKGICGKDSVTVNGGELDIVSGDDGISSNNSEDE